MANAACLTTTGLEDVEATAAEGLPCSLQVDADNGPPVVYREYAPRADLKAYVVCTWTLDIRAGRRPHRQNILPDGCSDIIWMGEARPIVVGPMTRPALSTVTDAMTITGVRFRPEAAAAMLGVPANELTDRKIDLDELWRRHVVDAASERLWTQRSADGRINAVQSLIHSRIESSIALRRNEADALPDPIVQQAIARLAAYRPGGIGEVARQASISERQLRRRFLTAAGYSPKLFQRVVRFQRLLALAKLLAPASAGAALRVSRTLPAMTCEVKLANDHSSTRPTQPTRLTRPPRLGDTAHIAGYADQAHMTREVAEFAGVTPSALLGKVDSALALYDLLHTVD
jgi:AraC-like DNA-binding protein